MERRHHVTGHEMRRSLDLVIQATTEWVSRQFLARAERAFERFEWRDEVTESDEQESIAA